MNKEQLARFWVEFHIPTQDDDSGFPFANPSDAARSLIRSRNWVGVITEELLSKSEDLTGYSRDKIKLDNDKEALDRLYLARALTDNKSISSFTKNKEIQKSFILSSLSEQETVEYKQLISKIEENSLHIFDISRKIDHLNQLLRTISSSTEWVIQYLNWCKHEVRAL